LEGIAALTIKKLRENYELTYETAGRRSTVLCGGTIEVARLMNGTRTEDVHGQADLVAWTSGIPLAVVVKALIEARKEVARAFRLCLAGEADPVFDPELATAFARLE
jgi:hypothetical protein